MSVNHSKTIDSIVTEYMQRHQIPGLSVAIVQAPYITRITGYGIADTEDNRRISSNTMFPIGQMTAAYTAVAVMQLKEEGKLVLDSPISTYLLNLPTAWKSVTVRQLLNHSSGIPSYRQIPEFGYASSFDFDKMVQKLGILPLEFLSGTQVSKSATNYALLGEIIEKTSGTSYEKFVKKNQFDRLGLQHTCFISTLEEVKNEVKNGTSPFKHSKFLNEPILINPTEVASGYTLINKEVVGISSNFIALDVAWEGIVSSSLDISIWDIGLAGDILVKDANDRQFLYKAGTLDNGTQVPSSVGWEFSGHPGLMSIKGNIPGYSVYLARFTNPSELICVTLLVNRDQVADLDILARQIAGTYNPKLNAPDGAPWNVILESPYSVETTIQRFSEAIKKQGGTVFADIDQSAAAKKSGQKLTPTRVVLVGNPEKGTELMLKKASISIDLPFKAMAWQDELGQVWLSFTDPVSLGREYKLQNEEALLNQLYLGMLNAAQKTVTGY